MKNRYPSREKNMWEHALTRPLQGIKFEMLELMRADLFEFLDALTTCPYDDDESNKSRAQDIQRIAQRLTELTPRRAKALRAALSAGRIEYTYDPDAGDHAPHCGPFSQQTWNDVHRLWEDAR
jgi:hypothetical protein